MRSGGGPFLFFAKVQIHTYDGHPWVLLPSNPFCQGLKLCYLEPYTYGHQWSTCLCRYHEPLDIRFYMLLFWQSCHQTLEMSKCPLAVCQGPDFLRFTSIVMVSRPSKVMISWRDLRESLVLRLTPLALSCLCRVKHEACKSWIALPTRASGHPTRWTFYLGAAPRWVWSQEARIARS